MKNNNLDIAIILLDGIVYLMKGAKKIRLVFRKK